MKEKAGVMKPPMTPNTKPSIYMFLNEMRDEKEERKKKARSNKQTRKSNTPKAVTFPRKNELPQVGHEPTTLYTPDRALYQLSYRGSSAGWAQISHLIVHLMNRLTINSVYEGEGRGNETTNDTKHQTEYIHVHMCMCV